MQKSEKEKLVARLRRAADAQRRAYSGNLYHEGIAQGLDDAAGILGKVRCEEEPRWIPCSERVPDNGEVVLATGIYGAVYVASRQYDSIEKKYVWWHTECGKSEVIAWMPLPEAYEERREDD